MLDKKRVRKFIGVILLIAFIIAMILLLQNIFARYSSTGATDTDIKIAFFTVDDTYQEGNIFLDNLYPRPDEAPYEYTFTVSNFDGTNIAETSIDYELQLETTTNLPLEYEIEKKTNDGNYNKLVEGENFKNYLTLDSTGLNYIRKIKILDGSFSYKEKTVDTYKINVKFPLTYIDKPELEDLMENIKISVEAHQRL